jgi:putative transposase
MIDRDHCLPLVWQAKMLELSHSSLYYQPCPISAEDLAIMRRLDELHLNLPFAGSRMLRGFLSSEGIAIGRDKVSSLMRRVGISALYRRPNTSKPAPGRQIFPYLLRNMSIERSNQVWAMDITYIPMAKGFVYLTVVLDWFSRRVLSWRLSIAMTTDFCVEAWKRRLPNMVVQTLSIPTKAVSSALLISSGSFWINASKSAWMANERGGIMSSSSACGAR